MSNQSLENVNSQFIKVLKSLNIEDNKHQKLSINLDLNKKIKTIISIQSLEERKSNIPKYLNNSKSYISLLSLSISLTTKTLYTIFCNNNGREILRNVIEEAENDKASLAIDLVYRLIKTYNMEFDMKLLISKSLELDKFEVLELIDNFEIFFHGGCLCKMLIYRFLHKLPDEFVGKIQQTKFKKIYEYIKNNKIIENAEHKIFDDKIIDSDYGKMNYININENLEKVILDTLFIRNELGVPLSIIKETPKIEKPLEKEIVKVEIPKVEKISEIPKVEKISEKIIEKVEKPLEKEKKVVKKKMVFKKKESSVSYINIKWTKIPKKDTIFEELDLDYFKNKFTKEDLEYFVVKKEVKIEKEIKKNKESPMDPKKGYALNIALSRIKCNYKELVNIILNTNTNENIVNGNILNDNLINQLILYFPTDQEVINILNSDLNDKYVLFFKECAECIDEVKENLKGIKLDFLIKNFNISGIHKFTNFFSDIYNSKYIKELLGSVLYIGNIVNKGSTYGGAEGFNINDILNILNMRITSSNNKLEISKLDNKVQDMNYIKKDSVQTVKDILKSKIPPNDVNLSVKSLSYDNLLSEIKEIINIKKELSCPHKKYDDLYSFYLEMMEMGDKVKKRYFIDRINDEIINTLILLCEITEKHN